MFGKPSIFAFVLVIAFSASAGCGAGEGDADDGQGGAAGEGNGGAGGDDQAGGAGPEQGGAAGGGSGGSAGNAGGGGSANAGGQGGAIAGMGGSVGGTAGGGGASAANPYNLPTNRAIFIQPLGDSITEGKGTADEASYRRPLWKKLKDAGYNVDFVGSRKVQLGDAPHFYKDYDHDHEGHYGWRLAEIIRPENIDQWLKLYTPDVALVHLGTNDSAGGGAALVMNTETLVKKLRADNAKMIILLAQLIQPGPTQQAFNSMLPSLAERWTTDASPIFVVNQTDGFTKEDTLDGIHPNPAGQEKMAAKWFARLTTFLPKP